MSTLPKKLLVIAGAGNYPRLVIDGAHKAGVPQVDIVEVRGSTDRATVRAADNVKTLSVWQVLTMIEWAAQQEYDGAILAGQISPKSLFSIHFDASATKWLSELPSKNAHTIFGKLVAEFEARGVRILPASCFLDDNIPGEGVLTSREPDAREWRDISHASLVARDIGRHDVGQTTIIKEGMILAVEAFEGTDAAIKRAGKLGGKGAVVFKAAREGHDMRFDIPVIGIKTIKTLKAAGVNALAFQANRLVILDKEEVLRLADKYGIAIVGVESGLPAAPLRP